MRLKEDTHSWRSHGIQRRMYRQAPLTPEEETTRHRSDKRKKRKHVHEWKSTQIGWETRAIHSPLADGTYERHEHTVPKMQVVCVKCGYKRGRYWAW